MSIFEELKRRKVFRVTSTYAVVAWVIMQIGEVVFPALRLPEWVLSTVVIPVSYTHLTLPTSDLV